MTLRAPSCGCRWSPLPGFFRLPVLYLVSLSFKTKDDVLSGAFLPTRSPSTTAAGLPVGPDRHLHRQFGVVAILAGLLTLVITLPAAYAVLRVRIGGAGIGVRPDPVEFHGSAHRRHHPLFYLLKAIGLLNTAAGLVLVYGTANVPVPSGC